MARTFELTKVPFKSQKTWLQKIELVPSFFPIGMRDWSASFKSTVKNTGWPLISPALA
jgi:hypothetical protein